MKERKKREKIYIYGKHSLEEALKNKPYVIKKVFLSLEYKTDDILNRLKKEGTPISFIKNKQAGKMVGKDAVHQGVIGVVDLDKLVYNFADFIKEINLDENIALVVLDELTDPQNVGSIIRSAAAFGICGVLLPKYRQSGVTPAVVKVSAGTVFSIPIVEIDNVNYTLDFLKEKGFKVIVLDVKGNEFLNEVELKGPLVFVLGNEGFGIRKKTLEKADVKLRIPISRQVESLNVAVSAALVFYSWYKDNKKSFYEKF